MKYEIKTPVTKQDGLANAIKMAYNALADGNSKECLLQLCNIIDDVQSKSNPYLIDKAKPRKSKLVDLSGCGNID